MISASLRALFVFALGTILCLGCGGKKEPTPPPGLESLQAKIEQQDYDSALQLAHQLLEMSPTDSSYLYWTGRLFMDWNRPDSALVYLKRLYKLYPHHLEGARLLYKAARSAGDQDTEIEAISTLVGLEKSPNKYRPRMAEINFDRGKYNLAIRLAEMTLTEDPENQRMLFILGNSLAAVGRFDSALTIMEMLDVLNPGKFEVMANLAMIKAAVGQLNEAYSIYRQLLDSSPDFVAGWVGLAEVQAKLGDTTSALASLDKSLALDSTLGYADTLQAVYTGELPDSVLNKIPDESEDSVRDDL
jgi:tetratricopeptide (TPR) repeat protein